MLLTTGKTQHLFALAVSLAAIFPSLAKAQESGVEMGMVIADEYCSRCHNIERGGPFKLEPPSFAAIAKYRTAEQVRQRIVRPIHEKMPRYVDYMIGGNIPDMVAYIMSLESE
jgi:mono/diheme cytochrome c family protein